MRQLNVYMLPELAHPHKLAGKTVVVVDILRATTTIATALDHGAVAVLPCLEVDEARNLAQQHRESLTRTLLAGERKGLPIKGFDLGNSPAEYGREAVEGCLIVFTTTNGTKAMRRAVGAGRLLTGAFANLSATWDAVADDSDIEIICAGTDGAVTREDVLFAGAFAERAVLASSQCELNDQASIALDAWRSLRNDGDDLAASLRETQGGRNLMAIGHEHDISTAAKIDTIGMASELDLATWQIKVR